ncbi:MAG TPA: iron ABC transporter permease [Acetobacteraceae bacterium]|nr:iron ABC transporter permease [Acetobacteraceae bacterium]
MTFALPAAPKLFAAGLGLIVSLMVLPPVVAVVAAAFGRSGAGLEIASVILSLIREPAPFTNTLIVGAGGTVLAVAIGGALALVLVRTDTPGRFLLEMLVVLPLYVTPLLTAIAWSWLGSPHAGLINVFLHDALGLHGVVVDLTSAAGVILVSALSFVPLPFLLIGSALRGMDPALEDSARVHGASAFAALRRITLPLVLPAILASSLLVFVQAIGAFAVPAVLGMPSNFYVATTEIYQLIEAYPPRLGEAAAWGLILLVIAAVLTFAQNALLNRRSYATITGRNFRPRILPASGFGYAFAAAAWLYVALAVGLPVLTLVWAASIRFLTATPRLMHFSLEHFAFILLQYPKTYLAAENSMLLGAASATLVVVLGLAIGWTTIRTSLPGRSYLDQISMFPLSLPAMMFAIGLLWVYVGFRLVPIYGTIWILLLAYATQFLPIGVRAASGALRQLHPELEEAARVSGASWLQSMHRITLPLTRPTLAAAWVLLFVLAMQEVSASILLYSSSSTVLSVAAFDLWQGGNPCDLAALGTLQLAVTFVVVFVLFRLQRRSEIA